MLIRCLGSVVAVLVSLSLMTSVALAELVIEITSGEDNPSQLAVVPFGWHQTGFLSEDVGQIISNNLERSGLFQSLSRENMLSRPERSKEVYFRDWRLVGTEYLVVGNITRKAGAYSISYEVFNVGAAKGLGVWTLDGVQDLRSAAHHISDVIYQKLTNLEGVFSTQIMYVTVRKNRSGKDVYRLQLSDADGFREKTITQSTEPLLSPTWSPDGKEVAYVSFQNGRSGIYIQNRITGKQQQLTQFKGINGAPDWSPDGQYMAMTLSKDGNPEIYIMDLTTRKLKRMTNHYAIDTEPSWSPDGKSIIFTSNRGGSPQIYRLSLLTGKIVRLTFEGKYNARGELTPDGKDLVMVHRRRGLFHIGIKNLEQDSFAILTTTELDESPSIAPNGSMLIYATSFEGRGVLGAVSINGKVNYRLPARKGEVREPVWSPFLGKHSIK